MGQNQSSVPTPQPRDELLGGRQFQFRKKKLQDEYSFRERENGLRRFTRGPEKIILGEGAFGTVRKATNRASNISRAVKTIEKNLLTSKGMKRTDVIMEVELLKMCDHSLIMKSFEAYETSKQFHLVLEFCNGGSLGERVTKAKEGDISEDMACQWMKSVLMAIAYLHTPDIGIVHRDIKPDNFFFHDHVLKLGDFGVAIRPNRNIRGGFITRKVGTPAFMAPEIHLLPERSRGYNTGADVWSAGVVMLFILTAKCPFINEDGFLLKNAIIDGRLPMWENKKQYGLFQAFQQGQSSAAPSKQAQDLIRALLKPDPRRRVDAETAISYPWFSDNAMGTLVPVPAGVPLLSVDDFENTGLFGDLFAKARDVAIEVGANLGVAAGELEMSANIAFEKFYNRLEEMPAPAMDIEKRVNLSKYEDRFAKCCVCLREQSEATNQEFDYVCKQCNNVICVECLPKLRDLKCPICRLPAKSMEVERALIVMYNSSMKAVAEIKETSSYALRKAEDVRLPQVSLGAPINYKNEEALDKCIICKVAATWDAFACPTCARCICESCINGASFGPSESILGKRDSRVISITTTGTTAPSITGKRHSSGSSSSTCNPTSSQNISPDATSHNQTQSSPGSRSRHLHVISTAAGSTSDAAAQITDCAPSLTDVKFTDIDSIEHDLLSTNRRSTASAHTPSEYRSIHRMLRMGVQVDDLLSPRPIEEIETADETKTDEDEQTRKEIETADEQTVTTSQGVALGAASSGSGSARSSLEDIETIGSVHSLHSVNCCPHCADKEAFKFAISNYRLSRGVATTAAKFFTGIKEDIEQVDYRGIAQGVQNEARDAVQKTSRIGLAVSELGSAMGSEVLNECGNYKDLPWDLIAAARERKTTHKKLEHIDVCICCQKASLGSDFICPKCSAAVCSICVLKESGPDQSCRHCHDTKTYGPAIINHQFLLEQWGNVSDAVKGMWKSIFA